MIRRKSLDGLDWLGAIMFIASGVALAILACLLGGDTGEFVLWRALAMSAGFVLIGLIILARSGSRLQLACSLVLISIFAFLLAAKIDLAESGADQLSLLGMLETLPERHTQFL